MEESAAVVSSNCLAVAQELCPRRHHRGQSDEPLAVDGLKELFGCNLDCSQVRPAEHHRGPISGEALAAAGPKESLLADPEKLFGCNLGSSDVHAAEHHSEPSVEDLDADAAGQEKQLLAGPEKLFGCNLGCSHVHATEHRRGPVSGEGEALALAAADPEKPFGGTFACSHVNPGKLRRGQSGEPLAVAGPEKTFSGNFGRTHVRVAVHHRGPPSSEAADQVREFGSTSLGCFNGHGAGHHGPEKQLTGNFRCSHGAARRDPGTSGEAVDPLQAFGRNMFRSGDAGAVCVISLHHGSNNEPLAADDQEAFHHGNFPGTNASMDNNTTTTMAADVRSSPEFAGPFALFSETTVQSVWLENSAEMFNKVICELRKPGCCRVYIALDLEYVASASTNMDFRPYYWNDWYQHLCAFVNGGKMVQVGLVFAFEAADHHHGGAQAPSSVIALEINLKVDVDAHEHNSKSITFLQDHGRCLAEHSRRGVTTEQFLNGLLRHLFVGDDSITWVTFHGERDFGFIHRLLQPGGRGVLPADRATFMRLVHRLFPVFYDVRVLGQLVKEGFAGSLTALAALLGFRRAGGEHHAGSDALLTLLCFKEILRRLSEHELHRLDARQCLLSGMEEFDMGIKCARHIDDASFTTVEVRGHNFDDEARRIDELVRSNFKVVGVHVQLPPSTFVGSAIYATDAQQDYDFMKSILEAGIGEIQVTIGFMNAEGMLAYGRVWKFHIRCSNDARVDLAGDDESDYVHPRRLAWLMASCNATHNPNVAWVTYHGSLGFACLIKSFLLAVGDLPSNWSSYMEHRQGCFPCLYDVGLIAQTCPDIGKLCAGCICGLYGIARNLKVVKEVMKKSIPKVVLVLRCYNRMTETPYFSLSAGAVQGRLMASQSRCMNCFDTSLMEDS